ncbi:MAG: hypothetical protein COB04_19130 [Gammaproteobacteria bacterium]|nr:MAG: hypothetical protein COB04_19130 [Gammaproteobacteria bacterium]
MKFLITFLALCVSGISSASEEIKFHDGGNDTYVVELISSEDIGEKKGLEIIGNAATKKCGDKSAHFGKYRFQGQENLSSNGNSGVKSFRMIQQLLCGDLPTITQEATKPLHDQEKRKLESLAKKFTSLYLDYLAQSDFEKAYSLLSSVLKEGKTYKEWLETKRHLIKPPGDLMRSEVWGVTTYVDPPSSPRKGVYIATDFDREYSRLPVYCGYLVWYLDGGELRVIREDIGSINLDQFNNMKDEELRTIKSKFKCKP